MKRIRHGSHQHYPRVEPCCSNSRLPGRDGFPRSNPIESVYGVGYRYLGDNA